MRLHRFFVEKPIGSEDIYHFSDEALSHQLKRVFRFHEGDKAILFDGSGVDYVCEIVSFEKNGKGSIEFRIVERVPVKRKILRNVALAVSLIKKDNFEWIIQKATEIGVTEFIPLISERSEKKGFNFDRAQKIMIEACEQSGRGDMPVLHEPMTLGHFLEIEKREMVVFHTEETGAKHSFSEILKHAPNDIVACIGPEGGWSEKEVLMWDKHPHTKIATLDYPILRAETAAIVAATLLLQ